MVDSETIILTFITSSIVALIVASLAYWFNVRFQRKFASIERVWWEQYDIFKDLQNELSALNDSLIFFKFANYGSPLVNDESLNKHYDELNAMLKPLGIGNLDKEEFKLNARISNLNGKLEAYTMRYGSKEYPVQARGSDELIHLSKSKVELAELYKKMARSAFDAADMRADQHIFNLLGQIRNMRLIVENRRIEECILEIVKQAGAIRDDSLGIEEFDKGLEKISSLIVEINDIAVKELRITKLAQEH